MPTAVVAGGSVSGLASAIALSSIGYRVLVLERAAPPPRRPLAEVAHAWRDRPTVPQSLQSHTLTSLGVRALRTWAPDVLAQAEAAGAPLLDLTHAIPAHATDRDRRAGDEDLVALGCRRTTLEHLLHEAAGARPGVSFRHGTVVSGMELDRSRRRVRSVLTHRGERIPADVLVDATGRRAASRRWLGDAGVPVAEDRTSPAGLSGYSRFYRLDAPGLPGPLNRGHATGDVWNHYAGVLHPGDDGTFAIALGTLPGDRALAGLRTEAGFTAAARATPGLEPWLEDGVSTPISPVHVITSPPNTLRGGATTLQHPVAGLFPVGDAACVTNPLFGRGMSLALEHAFRVAELLADRPGVDTDQRRAVARMTEDLLLPWYEHSAASDQARIARWRAAVDVLPPPGHTPSPSGPPALRDLAAAARADGVVWRGLTRVLMSLTTPAEALRDEELLRRVRAARPEGVPERLPPDREALVRLVAAAEGALP
ncbi:FAD-dependent monooxygenase [Streptomyces sp. MRC013]|uniref:FAD-dependent oxidoreductase n=1 Tax=Streptomyces sp. MRC013 TaxID=2898276 RepID=UPI00202723A8|nr:FAD-dependent monooxygenase [Streptomyces sp. MRC013]URM89282.1 FAD-dependent monooxygenase [Streptomyces sp. MRC013]